jgi:SAM-dependent methyltransferase
MILKGKKDSYGQLLRAYFNGADVSEILEREDGFITCSSMGPKTYFSSFDSWDSHVKDAIQNAKGRVLDIGCGAGRFSLYLQSKNLDVTGIDNSKLAIDVCRQRRVKNALCIGIEEIDGSLGKFDTFVMMGNNFGLFGSFDKAKTLLKKFHKISNDNAIIIAESRNPYCTTNKTHLDYHKRNRNKGRMASQIMLRVRYLEFKTPYFDYLLASPTEISEILKNTGWKLGKNYGNEEGSFISIIERIS